MKEWLDSKGTLFYVHIVYNGLDHMLSGIAYPDKALKKDLWDIIKKSRTPPVYAIDKIAEEKGGF